MSRLKRILKRLRAWPPLNRPVTATARAVARVIGWQPEALPRHLHRVGLVTSRLPDGSTMKLWSRGDDWVSNRIFWYGWKGYEPETTPLLRALATRAAATIDVGSYVGFYTVLAALANRKGFVYAFEPMPAIFRRLERNIALNALDNVAVHQAAVGESTGTAEFFFTSEFELPTSSSLSSDFMDGTPQLAKKTVPVVSLDDFAREHAIQKVDLMKIDTESTEPAVLRGARMILERDRPNIICEVLHERGTAPELERILTPLGYRFYLLTPEGLDRRDHIETHPEHLNYLFTTMNEADLFSLIKG